ncbi:hypothetical protein R1sor_009509 [Riccia sorocarpa]|uniref:F-box/LRR-repeat protein 15-like leucin rich repeat domain-containing protein n=1 Tax=Riccia sorocarpa TaxID=122646 RepID=A0ABD3HVB4_9MARC
MCTRKQCFDLLDDYLLSMIFQMVGDPGDRLSLRLVCKRFLTVQISFCDKLQVLRPHILSSVLQRYTELKHLDLSLCHQVQDKDLNVVAGIAGPRLQSLNLSCVSGFTDQGLMCLATRCTALKSLDLSNCLLIGDEEMSTIAGMANLEALKLSNCRGITDDGLVEVAKGCAKLQTLCLKSCSSIADAGVIAVADYCKQLQQLDLSLTEVTGVGFSRVALLKTLKTLTMAGCHHLDNNEISWPLRRSDPFMGWTRMAGEPMSFTSLDVVKLNEACTAIGSELAFPGSRVLRELSLSKCRGVTDEGLYAVIKGCSNLERLDLTCCHAITDKSMWVIARFCKKLRSLNMESCSLVTEQGISLIGLHCPLLEELNLTECNVNDQCLEKVANCKGLKVLKLAICTSITDVGLQYIGASCHDLREIDLYRSTELGDSSIEALASGCPNLSVINISYCSKLTDASLYSLSKLHELTSLDMRSLLKVTCDGVQALSSGCRKLEKVDMKRCLAVMDWGVKALAENCVYLRQICLSYCWMITDDGLLAISSSEHMENMSLLHLEEVSVKALEAALRSGYNLVKVKLSAHLREEFSQETFQVLTDRGCRIKWLVKPSMDHLFVYPSH